MNSMYNVDFFIRQVVYNVRYNTLKTPCFVIFRKDYNLNGFFIKLGNEA